MKMNKEEIIIESEKEVVKLYRGLKSMSHIGKATGINNHKVGIILRRHISKEEMEILKKGIRNLNFERKTYRRNRLSEYIDNSIRNLHNNKGMGEEEIAYTLKVGVNRVREVLGGICT